MQRQVGPLKSDAFAEWDAASAVDAHALFEMMPGATAATLLSNSWLMRADTVRSLQRKVEATVASRRGRKEQAFKRAMMWHDSPTRVPRESVKSIVTLDYCNYTLTIISDAVSAPEDSTGHLSRYKSGARRTLKIHCADCRTVEVNGAFLTLSGLTVDDGVADGGWSEVLKLASPGEAQEWKGAITQVCQQAKSLSVRFQRLRLAQSRKRHTVHERLILQRTLLDEAGVWSQFDGLSTASKNKLLRQLTKERDKRVPGVNWVPEDTAQCQHVGCKSKFGIRLGIPHNMHHCRLCGMGVCGKHFVDEGARLPASAAHEGVPPEPRMEPLDDQTTAVERVLGRSRLELLNTEVDVYNTSSMCWVVGRISNVDSATGDVTVSYTDLPGPDDGGAEVMRLKKIKSSAASSIRLHQVTPWSELSVPVCITCLDLLRTVDELTEAEQHVTTVEQMMSAMSDDSRTVKNAGNDAPLVAKELRKVWEARTPLLGKVGLKVVAIKFSAWLKAQEQLSPDDAAWEASMRQAGLLDSAATYDGGRPVSTDMVKLIRNNISTMVQQVPGLKALIVDETTAGIVSASFTLTALAEQAIVIGPESISSGLGRQVRHKHVRAIVWVRPTDDNIEQICKELQDPSFAEYHICFSSREENSMGGYVKRLAIADRFEVVREVSECLGEWVAISPEMFSLEVAPTREDMSYSERVRRLQSVMLSLGRRPIIRYSKHSEQAAAVAQKLATSMAAAPGLDEMAAGGRRAVLLIVDREDDPFTPLMNQWTFMAMQHELLLEAGSCGSSRTRYTETGTGAKREIGHLPPGGSVDFGSTFASRHMHDDWAVVCEGYERMKAQHIALIKEIIAQRNATGRAEDVQRAIDLMKLRVDPSHTHDVQCIPLVQELEKRATHQHAEDVARFQVRLVDCADATPHLQQPTDYRHFEQHRDELTHLLVWRLPLTAPHNHQPTDGDSLDSTATGAGSELAMQGIALQRKRVLLTFALRYPRSPTGEEAWLELCTQEEKELVYFVRQSARQFAAWIPLRESTASRQFYEMRWDTDPILTYRPRLDWTLHRLLHKKLGEEQYAFCCEGDEDEIRSLRHAFARPVRHLTSLTHFMQ